MKYTVFAGNEIQSSSYLLTCSRSSWYPFIDMIKGSLLRSLVPFCFIFTKTMLSLYYHFISTYNQIPINLSSKLWKRKANFKENSQSNYKQKIHGAFSYKKIYFTNDLLKGASSQTTLKSIKDILKEQTLSTITFAEIKPKWNWP